MTRQAIVDQTAGHSYVVVPSPWGESGGGFYIESRDFVTGEVDLLPPWFATEGEAKSFVISDLLPAI